MASPAGSRNLHPLAPLICHSPPSAFKPRCSSPSCRILTLLAATTGPCPPQREELLISARVRPVVADTAHRGAPLLPSPIGPYLHRSELPSKPQLT